MSISGGNPERKEKAVNRIVESPTGFLFKPRDAVEVADTIEKFFASHLFGELDDRRQEVRDDASSRRSWSNVAEISHAMYQRLTEQIPPHSRLLHYVLSCSDSGRGC